jgi:small-conductance mechanosensitive channel
MTKTANPGAQTEQEVMAGLATVSEATANPGSATQVTALRGFWHEHAEVLITRPIQVAATIVVALVFRRVVHHAIDRLTRSSANGKVPRILIPLKERAAHAGLWESSGLISERRRQRADTIGSVLKSAVSFLVFVLAFLVILDLIGLNLLPFVATTSIVGVALGFGAQNIVKDFLAGMFMILEDQYGVGDVIDLKEATGTVEAVGLRTTRLRDVEGTVWYVRNGEIIRVGNQSQQYAQVVLDIPIAAGDNVAAAIAAIEAAASDVYGDEARLPSFIGAPEVLGVESLTREETVIRLVARVKPLEQWRVARELRGRIVEKFDEAGLRRPTVADA